MFQKMVDGKEIPMHNGEIDRVALSTVAELVERSLTDHTLSVPLVADRMDAQMSAVDGYKASSVNRWAHYAGAVSENIGKALKAGAEPRTNVYWHDLLSVPEQEAVVALANAVQDEVHLLYDEYVRNGATCA